MRSIAGAIALYLASLSLMTCARVSPTKSREDISVPAQEPVYLNDWRAALHTTLVSVESGQWEKVLQSTSWDWEHFDDYRLYYRARAFEQNDQRHEAAGLYARVASDTPLSIFSDDARERRFLALAEEIAVAPGTVSEAESWAGSAVATGEQNRRRYVLGRIYESAGRISEAAQIYRRLTIQNPASQAARNAEARMANTVESGFQAPPLTREELRVRADNFFNSKSYHSAAQLYDELLDDAPNKEERQQLKLAKALTFFNRRHYADAEELLADTRKLSPNTPAGQQAQYYFAFAQSRQGRPEQAIAAYEQLLKTAGKKKTVWAAEARFKLGLIHLQEGKNREAHDHFDRYLADFPTGDNRAIAMWWLAWTQYALGDYEKARIAFARRATLKDESSLAAQYWAARCSERLGEIAAAQQGYAAVVSAQPLHYYALLASARLTEPPVTRPLRTRFYADLSTLSTDIAVFHLERGAVLLELGFPREGEREYQAAVQVSSQRETAVIGAQALIAASRFNAAQRMIWAAFEPQLLRSDVFYVDLWQLAYPRAYAEIVFPQAGTHQTDPYIILALMREESRYRPDAVSPADAFGLLQLIMPTAKRVAGQKGLTVRSSQELFKPELNITLGTAYIRSLLDAYQNNFFLAFAGYNGGPRNVNRWLTERTGAEFDEFVEFIPYIETRNYVKKVTTSLLRYQYLYQPEQSVSLPFLRVAVRETDQASGVE